MVVKRPVFVEKELGYEDRLRDRLKNTIKQLDTGEMPTFTTNEVRGHMKKRRADWRTAQQTTVIVK